MQIDILTNRVADICRKRVVEYDDSIELLGLKIVDM